MEANTFSNYEAEATARYPEGLPSWSGLGEGYRKLPSSGLKSALGKLPSKHRELVRAIAKQQLEGGSQTGVSAHSLLERASNEVAGLLDELKDQNRYEVLLVPGVCSSHSASLYIFISLDDMSACQHLTGKG